MNMLISELQMLAADWRSWVVVVLMAVVAGRSLIVLMMCPYANNTADISDEMAQKAARTPYSAGRRFLLMMLIGIVCSLAGLFMIAHGIKPAIALALLVGGVLLTVTEPPRLRIRDNTSRLIASHLGTEASQDAELRRLRTSHHELVIMNVLVLVALIAALLAF